MNDQPFQLSASRRRESMVSMFQSDTNCLDAFESLEMTLAEKILSCWERFVLCLRNKWSIY